MSTISICGAGTMGIGIAVLSAQAGHTVKVFDSAESARTRAGAILHDIFETAVQKNKIQPNAKDEALARCSFVSNVEECAESDVVIEAIIEQADIKKDLYRALEAVVRPDCILASNTSSISITALAGGLQYPERFVGMHFFNPAHIMRLVEVIRGMNTAESVVETTVNLAKELGKTPVIAKDVPGFIVNRVARNFYLEAMRLYMEGAASIEQIDVIMRAAGFKMGPFELVDLIGVDVNFAVTLSVWEQYFREPRFAPALVQKEYVDAGFFGKKTGRGFYTYTGK